MFVIDNILAAPVKGFLWIARELHNAASAQAQDQEQALTERLSRLYMELETGQISPEQFDEQEREVLDRLDALQGAADADDDGDDNEPNEPDGPDLTDSDVEQEPDDGGGARAGGRA